MSDGDMKAKYQRAGFLWKLPMSKPKSEKWQKRLFVAKDGYVLYYSDKNRITSTFDTKPKGIVPLGGCSVETVPRGPGASKFGLRVDHPDFLPGRCLVLSCSTADEQQEWLKTLKDCGRVTMENALLGDSMIEKLKEEGTSLEQQKEAALDKLKAEAKMLAQAQEEKSELQRQKEEMEEEAMKAEALARQLKTEKKTHEAQIQAERETAKKLLAEKQAQAQALAQAAADAEALRTQQGLTEAQLEEAESKSKELEAARRLLAEEQSKLEESLQEMSLQAEELQHTLTEKEKQMSGMEKKLKSMKDNEERLEQEIRARLKLQRKLMIAEDSLKRLDAALRKAGVKLDIDVRADVQALMSFFEERVEEVRQDANRVETMKKALTAKRQYLTDSQKVEAMAVSADTVDAPDLSDSEDERRENGGGGGGGGGGGDDEEESREAGGEDSGSDSDTW